MSLTALAAKTALALGALLAVMFAVELAVPRTFRRPPRLFLEAVAVGVIFVVGAYAASPVARAITQKPSVSEMCKEECESWNDFFIMEVNLFFAGVLLHVFIEYSGLNRFYARDYVNFLATR